MLRYFCGLRTNNAVCVHAVGVHAIHDHIVVAGDADGHAVGVRAVGVHAVCKSSAGGHAVYLGLRTLHGYAVAAHAIVYTSTVYFLSVYVLQVPMLCLNVVQEAMLQVYCYGWSCCRCTWGRWS